MQTGKRSLGQKPPARIFLVDDHPIVRQGLRNLINQQPDLTICGEAETARQALERIAGTQPDLVIVDISLEDGSGMELIKDLRARDAHLPQMVVSMHDEALYAEHVLHAGARGYVRKDAKVEHLLGAIRRVLGGEIYLSEQMTAKLLHKLAHDEGAEHSLLERLTDRELEVLQLIGEGHDTRQIAAELGRSVKTIEAHRANIERKLNLKNVTELIRFAVLWSEEADKPGAKRLALRR